jgi:hypothetical protein
MRIAIKEAKRIREELNLTHLVIFGIDKEGIQHVCTHGGNLKQAKEAADCGNNLRKSLGWPDELCNAVPLKRICKNCSFWKDILEPGGRLPNPIPGNCYYESILVARDENDIACNHFEPKS